MTAATDGHACAAVCLQAARGHVGLATLGRALKQLVLPHVRFPMQRRDLSYVSSPGHRYLHAVMGPVLLLRGSGVILPALQPTHEDILHAAIQAGFDSQMSVAPDLLPAVSNALKAQGVTEQPAAHRQRCEVQALQPPLCLPEKK